MGAFCLEDYNVSADNLSNASERHSAILEFKSKTPVQRLSDTCSPDRVRPVMAVTSSAVMESNTVFASSKTLKKFSVRKLLTENVRLKLAD